MSEALRLWVHPLVQHLVGLDEVLTTFMQHAREQVFPPGNYVCEPAAWMPLGFVVQSIGEATPPPAYTEWVPHAGGRSSPHP